ncbi:MAG: tetratricopeptide repeat protein [Victivallales bacterium]|nr:tetratricopeptide repeat protein [Victivallales bacterium]
MKKTLLVVLIAFAALSTYAQKCYIVKADGSQQKAIDIKVKNANGDLNVLVKQGQQPILFSKNMYRYAVVPKPQQVEQLGNALLANKYDDVLAAAKQLFEAYKFLGWGDYIACCQAQAYLGKNNLDEANKALALAKRTPGPNKDDLIATEIKCLIKAGKYDKTDELLKNLMMSKDDTTAAIAFNMRGEAYLAQGQKKQAVLEYLKTLLLFDKKKAQAERAYAKKQAVAIMKELKDPRVSKIEAME